MILGVALPGTINKQAAESTSTWVVGQANPGVIEFMQYALTVVSAVRMSEDNSQVFLDNQLDNIYSEPQLHAAMGRLIIGLEMLDDLEYIYDEEGNTLVIEPDSRD
jgi:hypothetical protein